MMKSSDFQHNIGGTAAFIKITTKATKWYGQLSLNETFFADI